MSLKELAADRLWEFEGFLAPEEVSAIINVIKSSSEQDWFSEDLPAYDQHHAGKTLPIGNSAELGSMIRDLDFRISRLFTGADRMVQIGSVVRGSDTFSPVGFHRDNEDENMEDNRNAQCKYGILLYLNDNFDGGEICYPEFNIEYKPKPGALLIHYAGNLHGVNPISNGIRYSMTSFAWGIDTQVVGI